MSPDRKSILIRVSSLTIVACTTAAAYIGFLPMGFGTSTAPGGFGYFVILPTVAGLVFVWYPDTLNAITGVDDNWYITHPAPRWWAALFGWVLLFVPLFLGLLKYLL